MTAAHVAIRDLARREPLVVVVVVLAAVASTVALRVRGLTDLPTLAPALMPQIQLTRQSPLG